MKTAKIKGLTAIRQGGDSGLNYGGPVYFRERFAGGPSKRMLPSDGFGTADVEFGQRDGLTGESLAFTQPAARGIDGRRVDAEERTVDVTDNGADLHLATLSRISE
jgi:hypothetical protein